MASQLQNIYHLRTVAETSAKSCMICYKPSTAVLITPDNKDFFYTCKGHLKDRGFAAPMTDPAAEAEKKRKADLAREIEIIKKEYEEKIKKKSNVKAKKDIKDAKDDEKKDAADLEKEKDEKIKAAETGGESSSQATTASTGEEDIPRIYTLHRNFFQMRLDRIRNAEIAKRNRERLANPANFPSVPTGNP